VIRKS